MPHPEAPAQIAQMFVDVFGGVVAKTALEHRPVAVGAAVWTPPAGDQGRPVSAGVAEQRQMVTARKPVELFVGRKRQLIQVGQQRTGRIGHCSAPIAPDQAGDFPGRPPLGHLGQGQLPFAQTEVIDPGKVAQQRGAHGRDVNTAENDGEGRIGPLQSLGHGIPVKKSGGGGGKAHQVRSVAGDEGRVGLRSRRSPRSQAVMHENRMPPPLQKGGDGQDPQGRHAVGRGGDVGPTRDPVGSGRVHEDNAHATTPRSVLVYRFIRRRPGA